MVIFLQDKVTHDVKCFRISKPEAFSFIPGQATEVSGNREGWQTSRNPGLPERQYQGFQPAVLHLRPGRITCTCLWSA